MVKPLPLEAANAVSKAGAAIRKPVFGSKVIKRWDEDREEWVPDTKEITHEVPAWMVGLGLIAVGSAAVAGLSTLAAAANRIAGRKGE